MRETPIRTITVTQAIAEHEQRIRRMEYIYEMKSADMMGVLRADPARETAEVCFWMIDYLTLLSLRAKL